MNDLQYYKMRCLELEEEVKRLNTMLCKCAPVTISGTIDVRSSAKFGDSRYEEQNDVVASAYIKSAALAREAGKLAGGGAFTDTERLRVEKGVDSFKLYDEDGETVLIEETVTDWENEGGK